MIAMASKSKARPAARPTKRARVVEMLRRARGATIGELIEATGWQAHSVRGALSTLKNRGGLDVGSEVVDGRGRVYRVAQ